MSGPSIATRVRVVRSSRGCAGFTRRGSVAVERVDVHGTTVTYRGPEGRSLYGCDRGRTAADSVDDGRWCGYAYGLLADGRLRDPRLSLGCRDRDDKPIGFAWIQPANTAAYVVVSNAGYSAVYPVTGGLPVRVGTDDVALEASRATFDVAEHATDGRRLRRYVLEAAVSG